MSDPQNPLDDYFETKEAAKEQRKKHELNLLETWKTNGQQPHHLEPLLKLYEPVFAIHMRKKPPMVPSSAYKADLQTHAIKAFETYDPSRGAALNTHVDRVLKKSLRYGNLHANMGYIPEGQSGFIGAIDKARNALMETLGREPTSQEIHAHLQDDQDKDFRKLTPKRIDTIQASRIRDVPMSRSAGQAADSYDYTGGQQAAHHGFEEQQIAVAQNILPTIFPNQPLMHTLFHHTFATNGHEKITSTGELAKRLGKSQSQISRMKTQMGNALRRHMGLDEDDE